MSEQSLTDIIQETLAEDPAEDNLTAAEPEDGGDDFEDSEVAVDDLINGLLNEDGEDEEDDEQEESGEEASDDQEKVQVKVDGEIVEVTFDELKAGYQRQADYTRKAQALAAEREEFEQSVGEFKETLGTLQQLDSAWDENPVQVLAHFSANTNNPTHTVALLIKELATAGLLEQEFMEAFGITPDVRQSWGRESEVSNLRSRAEKTERTANQKIQEVEYERQVTEAIAEYDRQIDRILDGEGVELTVKQRDAFRARLAGYAHDNEITNLEAAYKALKYEESQKKKQLAKQSVERAKQKKATSVVGRSSSGSAGAAPVEDNTDLNAVIRAAMREVSAD
jgi:hypothetical protein